MVLNTEGIYFIAFAGAALSAQATPTSLIMKPIADFLAHREYQHNVSVAGGEHHIAPVPSWTYGGTLGLFDLGECGYDNNFGGTWINDFKLKLFESAGDHKLLVSGGFMNVSTQARTVDKYVMARYDAGAFRVHGGYYYGTFGQGVFGADFAIVGAWTGAIEHSTGPGATTWFAVNTPLGSDNLQLMLAAGVPWDRSTGYQYAASVVYGVRF